MLVANLGSLDDSQGEAGRYWDDPDPLSARVTLMESSIRLELGVENRNTDKALDFTTALHTYLR